VSISFFLLNVVVRFIASCRYRRCIFEILGVCVPVCGCGTGIVRSLLDDTTTGCVLTYSFKCSSFINFFSAVLSFLGFPRLYCSLLK